LTTFIIVIIILSVSPPTLFFSYNAQHYLKNRIRLRGVDVNTAFDNLAGNIKWFLCFNINAWF
jgi:hypothetical protein